MYKKIYKLGIRLFGGRGLHKIWPIGKIHDGILKKTKESVPEYITVFDSKLYLVPGDNMGLSIWGEEYEKEESNFIKNNLKPGGIFIDIGANIGFYTVLAAKIVGETGKVIAFEPDPKNIEILKKNIAENKLNNVVIEQKAVGERNGVISLYQSEHNAGDHCTYDRQDRIRVLKEKNKINPKGVYDQHSQKDPRKKIEVEMVSLDDYFLKNSITPTFLKIDIQGFEYPAMKGMEDTLKKIPHLTVTSEFWPAGIEMTQNNPKEYLELFTKHGYKIHLIEKGKKQIKEISSKELLEYYTVFNNKTADIIFIK